MVCIWEESSDQKKIIAVLNDYNLKEIIGMTSHVLVSIEGKYIREGIGNSGNILANLDGNFIREGNSKSGNVIAIIVGDEIKKKDLDKQCLFKIDGLAAPIEKAALTVAALMLKGQI